MKQLKSFTKNCLPPINILSDSGIGHLNRSVKGVTGKSPSTLIISRIADESKALLINTDWSISEVAFTLGFEYPSHFTAFLKKHIGSTPKEIRQAKEII